MRLLDPDPTPEQKYSSRSELLTRNADPNLTLDKKKKTDPDLTLEQKSVRIRILGDNKNENLDYLLVYLLDGVVGLGPGAVHGAPVLRHAAHTAYRGWRD